MTEAGAEPPADHELVPGWLERLAAVGWRLLAATVLGLVLLFIAIELATVTASIVIAAIVAATFAPYVLTLRKRGWSRVTAAAAVFLGAAFVIIATLVIIAIAFIPYIGSVLDEVPAGLASLKASMADLTVPPEAAAAIEQATTGLQAWLSEAASGLVADIGALVTVAILATFLTFFFLMDGDKAWVWALSSANTWRRDAIGESGHVALERVGGYLRGTAVIAAIDGLAAGIFLVILGVPLAAPLGVIVFFGRFIPYIGGLVTSVLLVLVTLSTAGTTAALILLVLITILTFVQGKFLAPVIYHKTVDIHPAIALVALPAGAALAGMVGLFAAIPVVAFVLAVTGAAVQVLGVGPDGRPSTSPLVPIWLDRLGQVSWRLLVSIALLGLVVVAAIQIPIVVMPLVLGIVLAATMAPLEAFLVRRGWRHGRAALGATLGATLAVIAIIALTLVSLVSSASGMVNAAVSGAEAANTSAGGNAGGLVGLVQAFGLGVVAAIGAALSSIAGVAVVLLLSILLAYYFLRDGSSFQRGLLDRIEPGRRSHVEAAGKRAFNVLGGYMVGTGAISIFGAVTQYLVMAILGIPFALPLAVLSFFGGFIPYIGSFITTGLAFLVTVATGSTQDIVIMAIFTVVFNIVQGNFVAPLVYSRVVSLHPAVVLVAIPAGAEIAGVVGMFLIVPFLGVVAAVWRTVLQVLDTEPVLPLDDGIASTGSPMDPNDPAAPERLAVPGI